MMSSIRFGVLGQIVRDPSFQLSCEYGSGAIAAEVEAGAFYGYACLRRRMIMITINKNNNE